MHPEIKVNISLMHETIRISTACVPLRQWFGSRTDLPFAVNVIIYMEAVKSRGKIQYRLAGNIFAKKRS